MGNVRKRLAALCASVTAVAIVTAGPKPRAATPGHTPLCTTRHEGTSATGGYGAVHVANSCSTAVQGALQGAMAKLYAFEAEPKDFTAIASREPTCAMAWWGAAMALRGNPLGDSPDDAALTTGRDDLARARAVRTSSADEKRLVAALDVYYRPYRDQTTRARAYAAEMAKAHAAAPEDPDIATFYALALLEGVDLNDKTYSRQKQAGAILERVMAAHPEHPGAPHYLIHAYDYTALAPLAVAAAERYPALAPASAHAQHMPAHIWSMLGRWDRSIAANRASGAIVSPAAAHDEIAGDIVYEHAFDFIAYARLQKGQYRHVEADLAALKAPPLVVRARLALERGDWPAAAKLPVPADDVFDAALARFTRAYGAARAGNAAAATREIAALQALRQPVAASAGEYWGVNVDIYGAAARAWLLKTQGRTEDALALMRRAAARDDGHEKHIYLENKLVPMRESLADMELAAGQPKQALDDYAASLRLMPNRLRSFAGARAAAEALGDATGAAAWAAKLAALTRDGDRLAAVK